MNEIQGNPIDMGLIKQEPIDVDFKSELIEGTNQFDFVENDPFSPSSPIWSLLVNRTLFLLQDENRNIDRTFIIKTLIKEVNELLSDVVNLFQECCNPTSQDEKIGEEIVEVDGLLVNCLPCHPQNFTCHYRINDQIPQFYNDTLFSILNFQHETAMDMEFENQNYMTNFTPSENIDIKQEIKPALNIKKKPKILTEKKVKEDVFCEQCGKSFKDKEACKMHIIVQHEKKKIFKCKKCDKSYSYRGGLIGHRKTCKGPLAENRWIFWGKGGTPKCIHPDCVNREDRVFTPAGLFKHIINDHTAPTEFVSL